MKARRSQAASVALAVALTLVISFPFASSAQDRRRQAATHLPDVAEAERLNDALHAQALYEHVLSVRAGGPESGPYVAPLHTPITLDPVTNKVVYTGNRYLWGGLDPIAVIKRYDDDIGDDPGRHVFIHRDGKDVGKPEFYLDLPTYPGSSIKHRALFKTATNRDLFEQMTADGSLVIMFGLNCAWGVIAGPAENNENGSHWAQPGLGAINVERFFGGRVTVLALNLYGRGDDFKATEKRWKYAIEAFELMLSRTQLWIRQRPNMPVIKVNN